MKEESREEPGIHAGRLIHMLSHQLKRQSFMPDDGCGLTTMQKHVLKFILMETLHRELYQKDLEEEFQVRRSTATEMLQLLEKNGFIIRKPVEKDARLKKIVPTRQAEALRGKILENILEQERKLREGIPREEFESCLKVLYQMFCNLTGRGPETESKEES